MRISDWSSDVCSSDLAVIEGLADELIRTERSAIYGRLGTCTQSFGTLASWMIDVLAILTGNLDREGGSMWSRPVAPLVDMLATLPEGMPVGMGKSRVRGVPAVLGQFPRSEEHTSELQSLMRTSYAVFCLKKKKPQ